MLQNALEDNKREENKALRCHLSFGIVIIGLLILFVLAVNTGSIKIGTKQLLRGLFISYDQEVATIYDLRFPRIFISMLVGAAVSVSGVLFQAVLKNPLADPGIIGISSGASFVAVLVTVFAPNLFFFIPMFSFFGGILSFVIVYSLSWRDGLSPLRIILVGVAVNAMFTGLGMGLNSLLGGSIKSAAAIVNGNITMKTWNDVYTLLPYVTAGLILAIMFSGMLNVLCLEDKTAMSLGVDVNRLRIIVSIIAVLLASISTAVAGIISFLGLIVPHIGRLLVGSDNKKLIPFSILFGAFVFLFADTIGRSIMPPFEVSAAIIMNIVGGPFFIVLLRRKNGYGK